MPLVEGLGVGTLMEVFPTTAASSFTWKASPSPGQLVTTLQAAAWATILGRARAGRQDLYIAGACTQNAAGNAVRTGIFVGNAIAVWIEWGDGTVRYAPTDCQGTINLSAATVIYTYTTVPPTVTLSIGILQNVLGGWNIGIGLGHGMPPIWEKVLWNQLPAAWISAGPMIYGMTCGPNGGGWQSLGYQCYCPTCQGCDDSAPVAFTLTVPKGASTTEHVDGSPFTLIQTIGDGRDWLSMGECGALACVFGRGDETLPPITPLTPNPIVDWMGIDSSIGSRPQLTKWTYNNRGAANYAYIEDNEIHWFLAVASTLYVGDGGNGIGEYRPASVYVIAVARGQLAVGLIPVGQWTVPISVAAFGPYPAISLTVSIESNQSTSYVFYGQGTVVSGGFTFVVTVQGGVLYGGSPGISVVVSTNGVTIASTVYLIPANAWFVVGGSNTGIVTGGASPLPPTLTFTSVGETVQNLTDYFAGALATSQFECAVGLWQIPYNEWCCYGPNVLTRIYPDESMPNAWPSMWATLSDLFSTPLTYGWSAVGLESYVLSGVSSHWEDGSALEAWSAQFYYVGSTGAVIEITRQFPDGSTFYVCSSFVNFSGTFSILAQTTIGAGWSSTLTANGTSSGSITATDGTITVSMTNVNCRPRWGGGSLLSQDPTGSNFPTTVQVQAVLPTGFTPPCEIECEWVSEDGLTWISGAPYSGNSQTPCPAGTSSNSPPPFMPAYAGQWAYTFCQ